MAQDVIRLARARHLASSGEGRRIREAAQLTIGELGRAIDVDQSTVYRWERGMRAPRGAAALRYAKILDLLSRQTESAS